MRVAVFQTGRNPVATLIGIILTFLLALFGGEFSSSQNHPSRRTDSRKPAFTPHDELYSVDLQPNGMGWTVGRFGRILHTADEGNSWIEQNSGTRKSLTSVSFAGALHGFAVGGGGIILATVDGGQSWNPQRSPTSEHLLEVHALSAAAFVSGAFGTLLSTRDGGITWRKHSFTWNSLLPRLMAETGQVEPNLNTVYFADDKEGWLGGEFGLILHTRDSGHTWVARRYGRAFPQIVSIKFANRLTGWAVGSRGTLLNTNDGGRTWREIDVGTKRDFYAVWIDGQQGLIAGQGIVLKTNTGGLQWVTLDSSISNSYWLSGVAGNTHAAVVVGQAGTVHRINLTETDRKSPRRKAAAQ